MKTIHIAEMIAQGGRDGKVEAPDGRFAVELSTDEARDSVTPEHLFGGAYAACFLGALKNAAEKAHVELGEGLTITSRAHLDEDDKGGYNLNIELRAAMPGVSRSNAQHLMNLAHQTCPYSKATRGNINVTLAFD
jgi:Ohr subfamily peroxiredoxin